MDTIKVLKRKDASSLVVGVVLALIFNQAVSGFAERPANWISGVASTGGGWRAGVWVPFVTVVVQLVVLELGIKVYAMLAAGQGKK